MDDEDVLLALAFIMMRRKRRREKHGKVRSMWVRDIYRQRDEYSVHHTLVRELQLGDREFFFK